MEVFFFIFVLVAFVLLMNTLFSIEKSLKKIVAQNETIMKSLEKSNT